MTRYVRVPIEAEERECGKCQYLLHSPPIYISIQGDRFCELFTLRGGMSRRIKKHKDGAPQRCPQCLAAEVKTEVPNG